MRPCEFQDLGRLGYQPAFDLQQELVSQRKRGLVPDQFLVVEHPHVITLGRNASSSHVLASPEVLEKTGIELHITNRGGDVTYHGPGQIVGYPIFDLRDWKRDVVAYVRAIEEAIIAALSEFAVSAGRDTRATGVWVDGAKVAAIGVHLSRWVTSHGFALNLDTNLDYFRYIVPCGLAKPVTSLRKLGCRASRQQVTDALLHQFERVFDLQILESVRTERTR